ncbi:MAG: stage II sporulation protein M [Spirochaetales bacterium]|nr:stage II sporulation protein M [Spirochaetales bacterium]
MKNYIKVQTPEKIILTYSVAPLIIRILAHIIDSFLQVVLFILTLILFGSLGYTLKGNYAAPFIVVTYFLITWFYSIFFEYILSGSSPGKAMCGIKVIKKNGEPIDFSSILIRNIMRGLDRFPFFHIVGLISALIDKEHRRLGDFAAGTVVVEKFKRKQSIQITKLKLPEIELTYANELQSYKISEKDLYLLKNFLNKETNRETKRQITLRFCKKIGYTQEVTDYSDFLYSLYKVNTKDFQTQSDLFIAQNRKDWNNLREISNHMTLSGRVRLSYKKFALLLPRAYRKACEDLSKARADRLAPEITNYLSTIVNNAHTLLYSRQSADNTFGSFFKNSILHSFSKNKHYVFWASLLFFGSFFASLYYCSLNPENSNLFLNEETKTMYREMYEEPFDSDRAADQKAYMVSFYIQHNTTIAFVTFAAGILFGLGSIFFLLSNGLSIGATIGYLISIGLGENIGTFITAHSVFELTGIALAGAAGMKIGFLLFKKSKYSIIDIIDKEKDNISSLICVFILFFFLAAIIEGSISPTSLPWPFKFAIALISFFTIFGVFILYPVIAKIKEKSSRQLRQVANEI